MGRSGRRVGAALCVLVAGASLTFAGSAVAQDGSTASISASPTTDLVDGQVVTVTGAGWDEYLVSVLLLCTADAEQCAGPFGFAVGDDDGNFSTQMMVRATFHDEDGEVDCRVVECAIVSGMGIESGPADPGPEALADRTVPISFDPSAPLLDPPSLVADPSTDLVDDQRVAVTGERFIPDEVGLFQCGPGFGNPYHDCLFRGLPQIDEFGAIDTGIRVRTLLSVDAGEVDCRVAACVLALFGPTSDPPLAVVSLGFDPDAPAKPPAELTVTPGTGLVDGQEVTVEGANFTPGEPGDLVQCPATARNINGCSFRPWRAPYAGPGGRFETTFEVQAEIEVDDRTIDCRRQPCVLLAGFGDEDPHNSARAPLVFASDAAAPVATPTAAEPRFTG